MATQLAKKPRGFGDHLTMEEEDEIVARLQEGLKYAVIAEQCGVSLGTIARINRTRKVQESLPVVVPRGPMTPYILGALAARLLKIPHDREEFQRGWEDAREEL